MQRFEDMGAIDPRTVGTVDRDVYQAFLKAIRGRRYLYVTVQKGLNVAKLERPGDDREMVRKPESCFPGEILQIEVSDSCQHMQTPQEVAFLLSSGRLAPASRKDFDSAPNWEDARAKAVAAEKERQRKDASAVVSLAERVASLEGMFSQMLVTAKALDNRASA